ncbi:hypothetical protein [Martelella endophytica]|uniref:FCP1 homology domain-containing protein n=1 Tax=Martelella endophytica TaxID=1486262 RepID=A0A0D5LSS2_MAREN|nr:hypothetical protein [Martelella endophytica]AJY47254.1 hypothetical protein TM49_18770 [Martelella endophytica]
MADKLSDIAADDLDIGHRPLVVCDVDEVVLQFVAPFKAFLKANGHELVLRTFSLNGNVFSLETGTEIPDAEVEALLTAFYDAQEDWQEPFETARETLEGLTDIADVLLLTAMPPRHREKRRRLLRRNGFDFPLIATERPKGEVLSALCATHPPALVFIDDMLYNCRSVTRHLPGALAINLLIDDDYRALAPKTEPPSVVAAGWKEAEMLIRRHIAESR